MGVKVLKEREPNYIYIKKNKRQNIASFFFLAPLGSSLVSREKHEKCNFAGSESLSQ